VDRFGRAVFFRAAGALPAVRERVCTVDRARLLAAAAFFRPFAAFFFAPDAVFFLVVLLAAFLAAAREMLPRAGRRFAADAFRRVVFVELFRVELAALRFAAVLAMVTDPRLVIQRDAAGERQAAAAVIDCRPVSDVSSNAYRNQREAILQPAGAEIPASTTEEDSV
jgi:hypothetical protein